MRWPWGKEDVVGVDAPPKPANVKKPKKKSQLEITVETVATRAATDAVKKEVAVSKAEILKEVLDALGAFGAEHKEAHAAIMKAAAWDPSALEPLVAPLRLEVASIRAALARSYSPENPPPPDSNPRLSEFGDRLKLLESGETGAGRPARAATPATVTQPPPAPPAASPPTDGSGSIAEMLVRELRAGFAEVKAAVAGKEPPPSNPAPAPVETPKPASPPTPRRPVGVALPASKKPEAKAKQKTTGPSPPDINVAEWQDSLAGWIDAWLSEHPDQAPSVPACFAALVEETGVFLVGTAANTFIGKNYANLNRAYILSVANGKMAALGLTKGKMPTGTREDVFWRAGDGGAEP